MSDPIESPVPAPAGEREYVIEVRNLGVRYRLMNLKTRSLKDFAIKAVTRQIKTDQFWALKDINLNVHDREIFGLIGHNGAGKSTLLKVVARVLKPTEGRVIVRGHVAPLLGVGAAFHMELTGRENVFLNGALLGYSQQEMEEKFERIVDFAELWRQRGRGKELLLKAIGGRRSALNVVDATAGLGRDSLLLASYGARVQMCERHPVVHALLEDGLRRVLAPNPGAMTLDPMFPESKKSALVKKEMRLFHHLVGQDEDGEQLLRAALAGARHRVVVKRPPHAPCLNGPAPQLAISGKAVRFDVYPLKAFAKG